MGGPRRRGSTLALGIALLSMTVGSVVAAASAVSGTALCAEPAGGGIPVEPVDRVCFQLVRTLSERVGAVTGVATAIVVLTMIGLARLAAHPGPAHPGGFRPHPKLEE